jgi:hypothetical protein
MQFINKTKEKIAPVLVSKGKAPNYVPEYTGIEPGKTVNVDEELEKYALNMGLSKVGAVEALKSAISGKTVETKRVIVVEKEEEPPKPEPEPQEEKEPEKTEAKKKR